jgi:hypothetical protein
LQSKAHLAELVDAADLKSVEALLLAGSSPAVGIYFILLKKAQIAQLVERKIENL